MNTPQPPIENGKMQIADGESPVVNRRSPVANPQSAIANPQSQIENPRLARSAGILGIGNIASRLIGLARDTITSYYFGSSGALSAFVVASNVPTMIYDLLVGGMLSAALVPVFSSYTDPERRDELAQIASAVLTLAACVLGLCALALLILAEPVARLLGDFADPALQQVLVRSLRLLSPAVLLFGLSGGVTGLLYSLKRFNYTAAGGAVFNLGIVIAAPLLAQRIGVYALPIGIVGGSLLQLAIMLPGLRDVRLRLSAAWHHPAVRRILRLYLPIALGLIVTQVQIVLDRRWASATGPESVSWMKYATTLIQLPLGLAPVAVSLAALPSLSQRAAAGDWAGFRSIFGRGLRLVLVLLIPAAAGLWALAEPVIRLLFEHGVFSAADTAKTAIALRLYLFGLLFAGVDFLLNYTFYARQDTRTPAIVGMLAVGFYLVAAVNLLPIFGFLGLVLADSVKQAGHAAIMTLLLLRSLGRLTGERIVQTLLKAAAAALVMGLVVWRLAGWLAGWLPANKLGEFGVVGLSAGLGCILYLAALRLMRVDEAMGLLAAAKRLARPNHG
ncbi:MAG: murein biosynthesis integral membrane protein MurJ [Chloroflexi bacterium]|nr:murein biosynthesis integral membrane protein MurJ [Chloroflexota bacterium]